MNHEERQYWLHRISNSVEVSHPLLEKHGLLSYGWSDIGIKKCPVDFCGGEETFNKLFEELYGEGYKSMRARWFLRRFLCHMKPGDYVLVPSWENFHVYEIVDEKPFSVREFPSEILEKLTDWDGKKVVQNPDNYLCLESDDGMTLDLGFFRRACKVHRDISRSKFADAGLTSRMKYRGTNIDCSDLKQSIEKALVSFENNQPINLQELILETHVEETLNAIKTNINSGKFEKLVAWYFDKMGAQVEIPSKNSQNKEGDVDVIATFDALKLTIFVQVKFHTGKSGEHAVEQVDDYQEYATSESDSDEHTVGWVISTCDEFSEEAKNLAKKNKINKIRLIDGKEFAGMLLSTGISNLSGFDEPGYRK